MSVHRIRLLGPWEFEWQEVIGAESPRATHGAARLPQDWQSLFGAVRGRATFRRKFHRPSNLEPEERVIVLLTGVRGRGAALLNGALLGEFTADGEAIEFDATTRLKPFNTLAVEISFSPEREGGPPGGLFEAVALEIRSS